MEKSSQKTKLFKAIGVMTGTSLDGVDVAVIETDGRDIVRSVAFVSHPYDDGLRARLSACLNQQAAPDDVVREYSLCVANSVNNLIDKCNLTNCNAIGFHGQTIHHDPSKGVTVQIGDGQLVADETGVDVVYDFRSDDMRNGGQGAPLIPVYHRALLAQVDVKFPVAIVNIGGVSNITWIGEGEEDLIGFDCGPGNAMIDDFVLRHAGQPYDDGGQLAAQGHVDVDMMNAFMAHDYFLKQYPKSLDRNDFNDFSCDDMTLEDGAATLTEMTVLSICKGVEQCPEKPSVLYVTGGGRHNTHMMERLEMMLGIPVQSVDHLGWNGDAMEAEGFAYMAVRSLLGLPNSFPNTTGCSAPTVGGVHVVSKKSEVA